MDSDDGNDHTHQLLVRILDRTRCLEHKVARLDGRADQSVYPAGDATRELVEYRTKVADLLPMQNDEMIFNFEQSLADSAEMAVITRTGGDRVCFYTWSYLLFLLFVDNIHLFFLSPHANHCNYWD
jgi:hypothetical protein